MLITKEEFHDFENAQNVKLTYNILDTSRMSRTRWKLTSLDINKYIYIADHYMELKNKYGGNTNANNVR
jgi:hypothetical protein|uniref:Uncharacterized protein n=1 Tax=Siphoviridae sp. ctGuJ10 TaxID=2825418 RepID=A0A8S5PTD7_9CAUD|nr:MAG TPA: hypothetical protein [Siphoviridae sp. ctGuJ10]